MSKYLQRGCYHFQEFANRNSPYAKHVDDLLAQLSTHIGRSMPMKAISAHEVGCGEGLILDQVAKRLGWTVSGNDIDAVAVDMARRLIPDRSIHLHDEAFLFTWFVDVILFCDSLEHIKEWELHLEWAKRKSGFIVIAVPDRHDPNGERDFKATSFDKVMNGWVVKHRETRHARHLTIWARP